MIAGRGRGLNSSAVLTLLVSPRSVPKSPYRSGRQELSSRGDTGEWRGAFTPSPGRRGRLLQSREEDGHPSRVLSGQAGGTVLSPECVQRIADDWPGGTLPWMTIILSTLPSLRSRGGDAVGGVKDPNVCVCPGAPRGMCLCLWVSLISVTGEITPS